jgi:hypothetical protein
MKYMKNERWRYATCTIEATACGGVSTLRVVGAVTPAVAVQAIACNNAWLEATDSVAQVIDLRAMSAGFTAREAFDIVRAFLVRGLRTDTPAAFIVPGGVMRPVTVYCLLMGQLGVCRAAFESAKEAQRWAHLHARGLSTPIAETEALEEQR